MKTQPAVKPPFLQLRESSKDYYISVMLHTQLQHLPRDTFKFYLKCRDNFFCDATTQASPSMLKHLSSSVALINYRKYPILVSF